MYKSLTPLFLITLLFTSCSSHLYMRELSLESVEVSDQNGAIHKAIATPTHVYTDSIVAIELTGYPYIYEAAPRKSPSPNANMNLIEETMSYVVEPLSPTGMFVSNKTNRIINIDADKVLYVTPGGYCDYYIPVGQFFERNKRVRESRTRTIIPDAYSCIFFPKWLHYSAIYGDAKSTKARISFIVYDNVGGTIVYTLNLRVGEERRYRNENGSTLSVKWRDRT